MNRKVRLVLAVIILTISISLLVWGLLPAWHETRIQPIAPADLQLPTPSSLLTQPVFVS